MASMKRRILGIMVISAGACAALPFRNEAVDVPVASLTGVGSRNELTLQLSIPATHVNDSITSSGRQIVSGVAKSTPTPQPQEVRRDQLEAPPSIASSFEPLLATFPAATFPVAVEQATPTENLDVPVRRHRIADGDTLEALAERYLGNRDHWRAIFEANDGILADRDILPIGKEIRIPSQVRTQSRGDANDHLVPIPPGLLGRQE